MADSKKKCDGLVNDVSNYRRDSPRDNRRDSSIRRDTTVARTIPTILISLSSGSGDRYAIPNTVQKQQIHEEEERRELRITESLIDEDTSDSDSSNDDDGYYNKPRGCNNNDNQLSKISSHHMNYIISGGITNCTEDSSNCQTPLNTTTNHYNDTCDKSTAIRNNTTVVNNTYNNKANLLDEEIVGQQALQTNEDLLLDDDNDSLENDGFTKRTNRRHSSDTFMSVYEDLATKRRRTASLGSSQPIKVTQNNSTRCNNNNTAESRGKQVKILVTTALQTVAEGLVVGHNSCDGVGTWDVDKVIMPMSGNKRMSIENGSNNNQRRNNRRKSLNIRAELTLQEEECAALKQKLETSRAEMEALQRDKSITVQSNAILETKLKRSQSEVEKLRRDLKTERRVKVDHQTAKQERGIKSRLELQNEIDTMRNALNEIKQVEDDRLKRTKCIETELNEAKAMISSLKEENESLRTAQSEMMNDKKMSFEKVEWTESCGEGMKGIEVLTNDGKTPKKNTLDAINSLGAACTPPRKTKEKGKSKENNKQANGECSLCFRQPKSNGVVKYCQCGKESCNKWAHATCLLNRKSVSSVSHPGSPMPSLPTILCDGIYCKEI